MRIPPFYRKPSWQRFMAGMAVGGIVSWFIFLYIFGEWQDVYSKQIKKQEDMIAELKNEKGIWQKEFQKRNEENQKRLTVQKINIKISNAEKYRLDAYSVFEAEDQLKEDISMLMAKDIETVHQSIGLMERIIENKTIELNGKRYKAEVKTVSIYTTLSIYVEIKFD